MLSYSLVSDLHMDTGHHTQLSKMKWEKNIIVAGDSGNGLSNMKFFDKLKAKGHEIFAVDGNHEHYARKGRSLLQTEQRFFELLEQERSVKWGAYTVLGVNGWYNVDDEVHWLNYMNDGRYVDAHMVNNTALLHAMWLDESLSRLDGQAIVVTHTAPCEETLDPKYAGSPGNCYYWNPRMPDIMRKHADKIIVWHHGHTHHATNQVINGVRVVTNPRGYSGENRVWSPLTMEI